MTSFVGLQTAFTYDKYAAIAFEPEIGGGLENRDRAPNRHFFIQRPFRRGLLEPFRHRLVPRRGGLEMFQKKMQRAAVVLLTAALLLTAPLQAAGWTTREAPGLLETAWGWLVELVIGTSSAEPSLRS